MKIARIVALFAAAACASGVELPPEDASAIGVHDRPGIGAYLVDNRGRALYAFSGDYDGQSACLSNCATVWRAVMTTRTPRSGASAVVASRLALSRRPDSTMQVMYNRVLLYYYEPDAKPGETSGHNSMGFGGRFSLVSPAGTPLTPAR